jgi:serine/threonine-protein kinase
MVEGVAGLEPGALFAGDYRVVRPLAEGGMGSVYVVNQLSTGKARALKLMRRELAQDADSRRRFELEARVGAKIESDHIVEIHSAGVDSGSPYIVMELLDGEDLKTRIERTGALEMSETRAVFEQLCHAVAAAHVAGIVHRDLKPENVFLARTKRAGGARSNVKVLDFGIAKLVAESQTRGGTMGMIGTPMWMAPEQTELGKVTPAADIWALGLMVYYVLTGQSYWLSANDPQATITQLLKEVVMGPLPPPAQRARAQGMAGTISPEIELVLSRCLVREPSKRFRDAEQLWDALGGALGAPSAPLLERSGPSAIDATVRDHGRGSAPTPRKTSADSALRAPSASDRPSDPAVDRRAPLAVAATEAVPRSPASSGPVLELAAAPRVSSRPAVGTPSSPPAAPLGAIGAMGAIGAVAIASPRASSPVLGGSPSASHRPGGPAAVGVPASVAAPAAAAEGGARSKSAVAAGAGVSAWGIPVGPPSPQYPAERFSHAPAMSKPWDRRLLIIPAVLVMLLFMGQCAVRTMRMSAQKRVEAAQNGPASRPIPKPNNGGVVLPLASPTPPVDKNCRLCATSLTTTGPIAREAIQSALDRAVPTLDQQCLTGKRRRSIGSATIDFVVRDGRASNRTISRTTSTDGTDECLQRALADVTFPSSPDDTQVSVTLGYNPFR